MKHRRGNGATMPTALLALSGSPSASSKTSLALQHIVDHAASREASLDTGSMDNGVTAKLLRLGDLEMQFCDGREPSLYTGDSRLAIDHIVAADALVLGTPIYRGAYTGLLKNLLDMLPNDALRGKPVGLVATGGSDHHYLALEHELKPVVGFFDAYVVPGSVYLSNRHYRDGALVDAEALESLHRLADSVLACATRVPRELLGGAGLSIPRRSLSQS